MIIFFGLCIDLVALQIFVDKVWLIILIKINIFKLDLRFLIVKKGPDKTELRKDIKIKLLQYIKDVQMMKSHDVPKGSIQIPVA